MYMMYMYMFHVFFVFPLNYIKKIHPTFYLKKKHTHKNE